MKELLFKPPQLVIERWGSFDKVIIVIEKKVVTVHCLFCQACGKVSAQGQKKSFNVYSKKDLVKECLYRSIMDRMGSERKNKQLGVIPLQAINQEQIERYSTDYNLGIEVVSTLIKLSDNDEGLVESLICGKGR